MAMSSNNFCKIILITGDPGVGKTTLIKKLCDKLKSDGINTIKGFFTQELRDDSNVRLGFDVIDINDEQNRAPLARTSDYESFNMRNAPKVGKYLVDVKSFESIALNNLNPIESGYIYVIDEIGKMEMFSHSFEKLVLDMINKISKHQFLFVATVPTKSLKLADKLKEYPNNKLFTVTRQNRGKMLDEVYNFTINSYNNLNSS